MKVSKKLLSFLIAFAMVLAIIPINAIAATSGTCGNGLTWNYNSATYTLTISGTGGMEDYNDYDNQPWNSYRDSIRKVIIGSGVASISQNAFKYCHNLKEVSVADTVKFIGNSAFLCCNLTTINIPYGIKLFGDSAFYSTDINSISIPDSVVSIGDSAFSSCDSLTEIVIPESVVSIGGNAFSNCKNLKTVSLPYNLEVIKASTFYGCSSLSDIIIPDTVKTIGNLAFYECYALENITIPESVEDIGYSAFHGCYSIKSFTVDPDNEKYFSDSNGVLFADIYNDENVQKTLIQYPSANTSQSYTIPDEITYISSYAFDSAKNLTEINIPESVKYIEYSAFKNCSSLASIKIPQEVTIINRNTFDGCISLKTIYITNNVEYIDSYAFKDCLELTDVYYNDTKENWNKINIDNSNEWLIIANKHFEDEHTNHLFEIKNDGNYYECGTTVIFKTCQICGYTEEIITDKHTFSDWINQNVSCGNIGKEYRYCTICHYHEYRETGVVVEHKFSDWYVVNGSCGNMGKEARYCERCNKKEYRDTEMIEHDWGEYHLQYSPTCISDGLEVAYCSICGNNDYRSIPSEGHIFSEDYTIDVYPTCTNSGEKSQHCMNCDAVTNVIYLPAENHNFKWKAITSATCTHEGVNIGYCTECGESSYEVVPSKDHSFVVESVLPTCTENGYDLYSCEHCDYEYKEITANATGHNYSWAVLKEKTCTADGINLGECNLCDKITVEHKASSGHTDKNFDGKCDICESDKPAPECSHACHSGGIFWRISVFFYKLFGTNQYCECGEAHY